MCQQPVSLASHGLHSVRLPVEIAVAIFRFALTQCQNGLSERTLKSQLVGPQSAA